MGQTTKNSRLIKAAAEKIYRALTNPQALVKWQVPGNMTGKVHSYELKENGGYSMSLYYPENESQPGKTGAKEDRFTAKFIKLDPPKKIIEAIQFDTNDPQLMGEMIMEIMLESIGDNTRVTFLFKNIPVRIKPQDNEKGTLSSLEKLAQYVEE